MQQKAHPLPHDFSALICVLMHETLQAHLSYRLLTDVRRCYRWCMLTKSSSIRQNETSRSNSLKTCHCKWLHAINVWWALATLPFHFSQGVIIFLQWPIMTMFRCRARNAVIWTCPMRRGCSFKQPPEASNSYRGWYVWKAAAIWPSVEKVAHADMLWKFRKLGMKGDNISDLLMIILWNRFSFNSRLRRDSSCFVGVTTEWFRITMVDDEHVKIATRVRLPPPPFYCLVWD